MDSRSHTRKISKQSKTCGSAKNQTLFSNPMKKILPKLIPVFIIAISLIAFLICAIHVFPTLREYKEADNEYASVKQNYAAENKANGSVSDYSVLDIDVDELLRINEDYVAWFYLGDLNISLPIVKEKENEINKYIKTTFEGTTNASGCLFIPYNAGSNFTDMNTFIYGHNMANGSMFGSLKAMYNDPKSVENPYFYIYLKTGSVKKYRIISVVKTNAQSELYHVPTIGDDYTAYLQKALSAGRFDTYVAFTDVENNAMEEQSEFVTLSTCYGRSGSGQRLLVIGVQI